MASTISGTSGSSLAGNSAAAGNFSVGGNLTVDGTISGTSGVSAFNSITTTGTIAATGSISTSGNLLFNSGYGSTIIGYGCRAWVNWDGSGGAAVIRGSGNVTSVTNLGTGAYTVNLTNAMPDVNYAAVLGYRGFDGSANSSVFKFNGLLTTTAIPTLYELTGGGSSASDICCVAVFR